jgi:iron complex outermembrane recepter protein
MADVIGYRPLTTSQSVENSWRIVIRHGLLGAALTLLVASAASAEEATAGSAATADEPALTEVVVTGSRIPQPNMTSVSPIQIVTAQDLQLEGTTDIHDLMSVLPQNFQNAFSDLGPNQNPLTAAGGIATADLRGLGPQRTLVLVDGRRLGVGDASTLNPNPSPDLNQIPAELVDRIDVVTGGASAVYGSDAIAGVVNFVMKHNFQGIEVSGQGGVYQHDNNDKLMQGLETAAGFPAPSGGIWDGQNRAFSVVMGTNFADDKGNIETYLTYRSQDPVTQGSRDFSACELHVQAGGANPLLLNQPFCDGSANSNLFEPVYGTSALTVVGNQLLNWPQAGSVPPAVFNSEPYEYITTQDTRYNAGFFAHYDVNDYIKPFLDFSFMRDTTQSHTGPSGAQLGGNPFDPTGNGGLLINCTPANPLLSAQEKAALCNAANAPAVYPSANGDTAVDVFIGRRDVEGGPRSADYEHENFRTVLGFKGEAFDAWNYEVYGSFYNTALYQNLGGYLSWTKMQQALLVTTGPAGTPVCQGGQAGCIPWNIFTQGGVTPAQAASLILPGTSQGTVSERILSANATGQLGKYGITSPFANDGVAINIGVERRSEALNYAPDSESEAGDLAFFGGAGVSILAGYHVQEEFVELRAPLVQDKAWVKQLTIGAAFRASDYSTAGSINTYKFDVEYAPTADVMLRYSFDRAIRAPNIIELYTPQALTTTTVVSSDPCAGAAPSASLAACEHTGVTPAEYGHITQCPAGQCSTVEGGNPNLAPEKANTLSFGVTFTPSYVRGFSASVDYYKILLKQEVSIVPQNISLNECLAGNAVFCSDIVRTPVGNLFGASIAGGGYVIATNQNIAVAEVAGIDTQFSYKWRVGSFGSMTAALSGTWLQHDDSQPLPSEPEYDCTGLFGATCQTVNPRWRHVARVTWDTPYHVLLSAQWRFIGSVNLDNNTGNPLLNSLKGAYSVFDAKIPSYSYLDLSAIWEISKHLSIRAGVNNILDKDPPLINEDETGTGQPNTLPTYDLLGRMIFFAFTAKF